MSGVWFSIRILPPGETELQMVFTTREKPLSPEEWRRFHNGPVVKNINQHDDLSPEEFKTFAKNHPPLDLEELAQGKNIPARDDDLDSLIKNRMLEIKFPPKTK